MRWLAPTALAGLTWLAACASTPDAAEPARTAVPGTRVSVVVPAGYAPADDFIGFANERGNSLLFTEWQRPQAAMLDEIAEPELEERGMRRVAEERIEIDGEARRLLLVTQNLPSGMPLARRILVIGDATSTSVVTATSAEETFPAELSDALRSVERDPTREIAPFEGLGFEVDASDALAVTRRVAEVVHMTPGPGAPGPRDPQLIAGRAPRPDDVEPDAFAAIRLEMTPGVRRLEVQSARALEIDGLPAREIVARGQDLGSRDAITLWQTIAFDERRYYLVQGRVASSRADEYLPEFRRIAASLRRRSVVER